MIARLCTRTMSREQLLNSKFRVHEQQDSEKRVFHYEKCLYFFKNSCFFIFTLLVLLFVHMKVQVLKLFRDVLYFLYIVMTSKSGFRDYGLYWCAIESVLNAIVS